NLQAVLLRLFPARAVLAHADDDVMAAVLEVERMRAALAAVAQDGDPGFLERLLVYVFARVQLRHCPLHCWKHKKNPASAGGRCGVFLVYRLGSSVRASGRRPAPTTPDKEQGKGKGYEHDDVGREIRAVDGDVVDDPGLHTMRAIAT